LLSSWYSLLSNMTIIHFVTVPVFCGALLGNMQAQILKNAGEPNKSESVPLQVVGDVTAPRPIYAPEPEFSEAARKAGYQGVCLLSLIVGANGKPRDIKVVRKLGMQLDEKAVEAVRNWTFEPARKDGEAVAVRIEVEVSYHLYQHGQGDLQSGEPSERALELRQMQSQIYRISDNQACPASSPDDRPVATIENLNLEGDLRMPSADRDQIATSLKQRTYRGNRDEVASEISERAKGAWQSSGYFNVQAQADAHVLSSGPVNERVAVTVQVNEGQQYRLGGIRFRNNAAIANVEVLRQLFALKDGDVFDRAAVGKGLEDLLRVYGEFGYAGATAIPSIQLNGESQTISLDITLNEGKQFLVSRIDIIGLDESGFQNVQREMALKPGDVYNQRLVDLFLQRSVPRLPADASLEPPFKLQLNEEAGTVAITYHFRRCHSRVGEN
jgi:TonB family protein